MGDVLKYEGLATNQAPFFDGSDYVYWKTKMTAFLKCEAEEVWDAVETGPYIPIKTVDEKEVLKPKDKCQLMTKRWFDTITRRCAFCSIL